MNGDVKDSNKPSAKEKKIVSVLPTLVKTFGPEFMFGAFLNLISSLLQFVSPQILRFAPYSLRFKNLIH